jgi:hypothetical protein
LGVLFPPDAVMAVIIWLLDLQLPMQSVPITTNVVSSNLDLGEVYNIISSINKTDCHYITEILLKVALNTIKQTSKNLM